MAAKITKEEAFGKLSRMISDLDLLTYNYPARGYKTWSDGIVAILRQLPWKCKKGRIDLIMDNIAYAYKTERWEVQYQTHCMTMFLLLDCIRMYSWWWDEDD